MSSQFFDAQLLGPDNNASHLELVNLITAGKFTGSDLSDVAHRYLDAFCNKSYSNARRRWAGIALAGMMRASAGVVQRLKKLSHGTSRIGAVILDPEENEERRIVAGLIIRQGLESGIDFADFWASDKVDSSAPNFPRDPSELWMGRFQTYLDTLGDLALTNPSTDPQILYPISIFASGGFQRSSKATVAIIEDDYLTIAMSDSTLTKFDFIDIPIRHVKNTSLQQDSPHESQEGRSGHTMHNLVLSLKALSSTYRLNSRDCRASEFKFSFTTREDADELDVGLQDARKRLSIDRSLSVEAADATVPIRSPDSLFPPIAGHVEASRSSRQTEKIARGQNSGSGDALDESLSSEPEGERRGARQRTEAKSKGKLPRISNATKQKVVRTQRLPPGPSKVTKPRASKSATPVIAQVEDDDEDEESSQDEYDLKSHVAKSQGRRKADIKDDDDYAPPAAKAKVKPNKRKRASSDAAEDSRSKKTQAKPNENTQATAVSTAAKKQKAKPRASTSPKKTVAAAPLCREPMKQSTTQQNLQNGTSSRPSLIGGMYKTKSPGQVSAATFKMPGQPASTPGRPTPQPVQPSPRPQTPVEASGDADNLPVYISSSTPRSQAIHEGDFGIGFTPANTEILSSNTKRVPDSPHAESTAISGHADHDDVHREKCIGDMQTARNDPFQQRRQTKKITSLYRRFTEESVADNEPDAAQEEPFSTPAKPVNGGVEMHDMSASHSIMKQSPSLIKSRTSIHKRSRVQDSPAQVRELKSLPTTSKVPHKAPVATSHETSRSLSFEGTRTAHASQSSTRAQEEPPHSAKSRIAPKTAPEKASQIIESTASQRKQANDSVISAPREPVEDTLPLPDAPHEPTGEVDPDGETTLVDDEMDMPGQYGAKASDLRFRSSPPLADSSSVQGAPSDDSEAEPEPSPPTSRADELEWEAALEPHQRALHEQLLRTSKRVVRHIVDNETAVTDVTDTFAEDGERLLDLMLERQSGELAESFQELTKKRQDLLKELSNTSKSLKAHRKQVRAID